MANVIPAKESLSAVENAEIPRGLGMAPLLVIPTKEESLKVREQRDMQRSLADSG